MFPNKTYISTATEIKSKIDVLANPGGGTRGDIALNKTFATLFNSQGIFSNILWEYLQLHVALFLLGDPAVYQNAIFLSDGNGGDILSAAENFHQNGIHLTSVALVNNPNKALMKKITGFDRSPPLGYKNFYFKHSDAGDLASHAKDMRKEILDCEGNNP